MSRNNKIERMQSDDCSYVDANFHFYNNLVISR